MSTATYIETPASGILPTQWETLRDYEEQVVIPALGEWASEHDTHGIASDMTRWEGGHLVEVPGLDFWEVCDARDECI